MPFNNRLLVVIRCGKDEQPALERGKLIAQRLGATLHLLPDHKPRGDQDGWLQGMVDELSDQGFNAELEDWGEGDLIANVLQTLKKQRCGLLLKYRDRRHPVTDAFVTPRDWKLLRYAPCPVLMIKQNESWQGRPLIAAVDADPEDGDHRLLNEQIVRMASQIADLSGGLMHLVSAFPAPMQSADAHSQLLAQIQHRYQQNCLELCHRLQCQADVLEVAEGPPETLIPAYSSSNNAGLVIMGTVARRGVRGALLGGNTAEAILSQLKADVLTLKPKGSDEILDLLLHQGETQLAEE
ncbi:MAG: universal stress protein [Motiliproteus sp.]|nr:universal stress protein [Motiliproteus sp.]MCW9051965.1 universal stress protein [Motiliproteus sp.]